jgi:CO dehydrogenase/acetyl-CoA synthase epsilon subunit
MLCCINNLLSNTSKLSSITWLAINRTYTPSTILVISFTTICE